MTSPPREWHRRERQLLLLWRRRQRWRQHRSMLRREAQSPERKRLVDAWTSRKRRRVHPSRPRGAVVVYGDVGGGVGLESPRADLPRGRGRTAAAPSSPSGARPARMRPWRLRRGAASQPPLRRRTRRRRPRGTRPDDAQVDGHGLGRHGSADADGVPRRQPQHRRRPRGDAVREQAEPAEGHRPQVPGSDPLS